MPYIVRFMITNFILGIMVGWGFAAMLLWHDAFGLMTMVMGSSDAWILVAMIATSVGGLFGVAFTATALEFLAAES